jgi:hypothetical protein
MMEARTMTVMVAPKPAIMQRVAQLKAQREKDRQQAAKEGRELPSEPSLPDLEDDDDDDDDDEEEDAKDTKRVLTAAARGEAPCGPPSRRAPRRLGAPRARRGEPGRWPFGGHARRRARSARPRLRHGARRTSTASLRATSWPMVTCTTCPRGQAPVAHAEAPRAAAAPSASVRTRGVYVPASVVMAYAKRGTVPASDGPGGVVLRGVGTGNGLADGDVVVRVPHPRREARPRRPRSRRQGRRARPARRGLRGRLHGPPPDARDDRQRRRPGGRGRAWACRS